MYLLIYKHQSKYLPKNIFSLSIARLAVEKFHFNGGARLVEQINIMNMLTLIAKTFYVFIISCSLQENRFR